MIKALLFVFISLHAVASVEFYYQSVLLDNSDNLISQGFVRALKELKHGDVYGGVYFDHDQKTGLDAVFTDRQVSPLIGYQSRVKFKSRLFGEYRNVQRMGKFTDDRAKFDQEYRFGFLGYDLIKKEHLFNEFYYIVFYSELYEGKVIAQGWDKHGLRFESQHLNFDLFNELTVDSFDFTKEEQFTVDFRPGIRFAPKAQDITAQLLIQYLIPVDKSGRDQEIRTTLVFFTRRF